MSVQPLQHPQLPEPPTISLPKGGGAIRGIGEKFAANPVTGTGSMTVPIATSQGRSGFGPQLALTYDSGVGNGPFGFGWNLSLPAITRKTDKGLPQYRDAEDSDAFILSGAEDLVPVLVYDDREQKWQSEHVDNRTVDGATYQIRRYRPRIEGLFARIERWTNVGTGTTHWRSITRDNITSLYGTDNTSCIFDPDGFALDDAAHEHPTRIFSWLIRASYDDKGNAVVYEYTAENDINVDQTQANELKRLRTANRYLKRIKYGNRTPNRSVITRQAIDPTRLPDETWMFEVVFDYGEGHYTEDAPDAQGRIFARAERDLLANATWPVRLDPFSTYRAGFEVRTYRLCRRVLMFHHFPQELGIDDCLVRATEFSYTEGPIASFIGSVAQSGYLRQPDPNHPNPNHPTRYQKQSLPPLECEYSQIPSPDELTEQPIQEVDPTSLENLPVGLDGSTYQWIDLDGEGVAGILTEQATAWFYKPNLGEGRFGPVETLATRPSLAALGSGRQQLLDLAGDGQLDLVEFGGPMPGFFERTPDHRWEAFKPFASLPAISWEDPNLRFVDLDGDGHADVLITECDVFTWYPSQAEAGFGPSQRVCQPLGEEAGPRLIFADDTQSIYLADLSGDGLTDLVRIRNGEVCYWPNVGYGRFGARVTMDNAPWFDSPDQFSQRRIRLADFDGSGTTDILYLGRAGVRLYFNQSGNRWSDPCGLPQFPAVDDLASVTAVDLLGNGTTCLVWSSPLPGNARRPMCYLDLMGGQKPHLLTQVKNNLGAETRIAYAPSTTFYLQDKQAGQAWITRLPFPVQCVEKVAVRDTWRNTTFSTTYSYHHGYFDGPEREFRGFGRVEQVDVEDYGSFAAGNTSSPYITDDYELYQPPVKTVTWFHTGVFLDRAQVLSHYQDEYFPNWWEREHPNQYLPGTFREHALPEPNLAQLDLSADEWREALRACKGMVLRQETYELDVDALAAGLHTPIKLFSTVAHNCALQRVQAKATNRHASFHVTECEAITYHYELDLRSEHLSPDPRIAHTLTLRVDEYGNSQQAISVVYPRFGAYVDATVKDGAQELIQQVQSEPHLTYTETRYTNDAPDPTQLDPDYPSEDHYRLRLPCEVLTYELTGIARTSGYFTLDELGNYQLSEKYQSGGTPVEDLAYHLLADGSRPKKRLVEHTRTLFFKTHLDGPETLGQLNALGLPYESYTLALSDEMLALVFKDKLTSSVTAALADQNTSGYMSGGTLSERFGDEAVSGQYWVCSGVAGFAADAAQHFYLPERYRDPFGNVTTLEYHVPDYFYIQSSTDPLGSRTEVTLFDFRVLGPCQMKDANENLSEVRFDILGMPAAMAVMGKGVEADSLSAFDNALLNPDLASKQQFFVTKDYSVADAKALLRGGSARYVYYFGEIIDNGKVTWCQHPACACSIVRERHEADQPDSPVQCALAYADGAGNVLVKKVQAEPEQPGGRLRWVASGKTILNNKGNPVKQYEPYFSLPAVGHRFEDPPETGVASVMYYDAVGRMIRTESPDGSYSRVEFSPWHVAHYDANDTVTETGNAWFARKSVGTASAADRRAARLAAEHANTPAVTVLDSLGREVVTVAHNRMEAANGPVDEKYVTFSKLDAEGKPLWVQDARGNRVMQYIAPPLLEGVHPFNDDSNLNAQGFAPCYDIAGNLLFQHSMDAGDRWMLNDAGGKPMFAWNSRGFITRMEYDALHRPTGSFVTVTGAWALSGKPRDPTLAPEPEVQVEKLTYGEGRQEDIQRNLRGKPYAHADTAGVVTNDAYDFKGNLLHTTRQLMRDYKSTPDWSSQYPDGEIFDTSTRYDALNRPVQVIAPHSRVANPQRINITQPVYNEAGLLERVDVWLDYPADPTELLDATTAPPSPVGVNNIDYDAKGQRLRIDYKNGATTRYTYDAETFRLIHLYTRRGATFTEDCENPEPPPQTIAAPDVPPTDTPCGLQNVRYTYDPVGNILQIRDDAQERIFHSNQCVLPGAEYRYDALYRLIAASGREHEGDGQQYGWDDSVRIAPSLPNDCQALQNYVETYRYDSVGNIMQVVHHTGRNLEQPGQVTWNRRYQYALDSNHLLATSLPGDPDNLPDYVAGPGYSAKSTYDPHGNITAMPHLPQMNWNFKDHLSATTTMVKNDISMSDNLPETTYYVYDAAGQRVRKITETQSAACKDERIYLSGFEIYRKYAGANAGLVRETVHITDDKQRIALIDTRNDIDDGTAQQLIRYQFGNHLDSSTLELDDQAQLISYEEYYPYGSTSYQAVDKTIKAAAKRYNYVGKERDEETGLRYCGARYYATWLGRWVNCDPIVIIENRLTARPTSTGKHPDAVQLGIDNQSLLNLYLYALNNPLYYQDREGLAPAAHGQLAQQFETAMQHLINVLTSHAFTRGTFEATLAEAQSARLVGATIGKSHMDELTQALSAIKNADVEISQALARIRQVSSASAKELGRAIEPLLQVAKQTKQLTQQTITLAKELAATHGRELEGVPLVSSETRGYGSLVSTQLQKMGRSLLPNKLIETHRYLLETIKRQPATVEGIMERIRPVGLSVTAALTALKATGRSATVRLFGAALEAITAAGGRLISIIPPMPSWMLECRIGQPCQPYETF